MKVNTVISRKWYNWVGDYGNLKKLHLKNSILSGVYFIWKFDFFQSCLKMYRLCTISRFVQILFE